MRLNLHGQHVLVVGGSALAARVIATLSGNRDDGPVITVVAPEVNDSLYTELTSGRIHWLQRSFDREDVAHCRLVIAATECPATRAMVRSAAADRGCLFNDAHHDSGDCSLGLRAEDTETPGTPTGDDPWRHASVCLVGAGPGDPGLLTVIGLRALQSADVVLYDRLIAPEMLALAPVSAERIFVGKQRARHHYQQEELNALMIDLARSGRRVVRLKGGDPFVFGRGGEEVIALAEAGIGCRVIPGITAGSGCATYAGIPLTHRDHAHSCQFITAYGKDGESEHEWAALVRARHTLVVYMGLTALEGLCPKLIEHGLSPDTPAALIERGTTPDQRVLTGTVGSLPELALSHELHSPALVIVGEVVRLRDRLKPSAISDTAADVAARQTT